MDINIEPDPFGAEADRLSTRIRMLEARLEQLPTKIGFEQEYADEEQPDLELRFQRAQKGWMLMVSYREGTFERITRLSECDLVTKARACKFLPTFIEAMQAEMKRRAELVSTAHSALDKVAALTRQLPKTAPPSPATSSPASSSSEEGGRW